MNDKPATIPNAVPKIRARSAELGFDMNCDDVTGALLKTLAASKPGGRILELGTGTGLSTAWLLVGMDDAARLVTVEMEQDYSQVAQDMLQDERVDFVVEEGSSFLKSYQEHAGTYDLVFADTWPGKFWDLELALNLVKIGGFYVIDDLSPQANWPEGHGEKVEELIATLEAREDFVVGKLGCSSGLMICTKF